MNITVFGGAGYLGSVLTPYLAERGHRVTVVDALIYGDAGAPPVRAARFLHADFRHEAVVRDAVAGADAVIHLGGFVGEPACALDPELTLETSLAAPLLAAELAREAGVTRFLFASTCSVYGIADGWATEASPATPVSLYGRAKVAVEEVLRRAAREDFRVLVLRLGTAYGLSPRPRFDSVVNLMTARLVETGAIPIRGGGQWRPFVHVRDIAQAFALGLERPVDVWDVLNVGSNELNLTIAQLAEVVRGALGRGALDIQPSPEDARDYRVRFDKVAGTLGFRSRVDLPTGVQEMADAILDGVVEDPFDSRYDNYRGLRAALEAGTVRPFRTPGLARQLSAAPAGLILPDRAGASAERMSAR